MTTCAETVASVLKDAGVRRIFGLPGGEILDFVEAARRAGIDFLLTRQESTAAFMADVTGQISGTPGVCVATLGPGAVNMTLGVANAYLDRSPVIAITASHARNAGPYATHQNLDLNAVYRPFTKMAITLDGHDTATKVGRAIEVSLAPRRGPVHIAIPSDVARGDAGREWARPALEPPRPPGPTGSLDELAAALGAARRPVAILGLDLDPALHPQAVRTFVERFDLPVFVTPKAKGIFPEDHRLFFGVCAGVSGDGRIVDFLATADLLLGIGFDPVESDKLWHHTMPLASVGPLSIAAASFRPRAEATGDLVEILGELRDRVRPSFDWRPGDRDAFRAQLEAVLRPAAPPAGLSGYELTCHLRRRFPRETVFTTDVGSVKMITSQAWTAYEPLTFFESNGLSAMSYALPAAMAARLQFPGRPILCTIGDGGLGMTLAEIETCVRERLHFVTVVFNDNGLSLIEAAQQRRGFAASGVRYGSVDFAAAARAMGAWGRRVATMAELDVALDEATGIDRPVIIDAVVDPAEYAAQTAAPTSNQASHPQ